MIKLDNVTPGGRVAVAMSGGVDSSVAAALLFESGYEVIGITLQLYNTDSSIQRKKACCAGQDIYDARSVADRIGFPHYVLNYESLFKQKVIDDFIDSYQRGETPIPCVQCNQKVKFEDLLKTAQNMKAEALVTGHYVQRVETSNSLELRRAIDLSKDQSYFLFTTTLSQLSYLRFPLGGMTKKETRSHAQRLGLDIAEKPESQDICFVPNGRYAELVKKLRPESNEPGIIVDEKGVRLGEHEGIIHYTIGQRKGLKIPAKEALYVIELRPEKKEVVVGPYQALAKETLTLKDVNWLESPEKFENPKEGFVKIRSTGDLLNAFVKKINERSAAVRFLTPQHGISKGQACVFFKEDRVLGGGWIY